MKRVNVESSSNTTPPKAGGGGGASGGGSKATQQSKKQKRLNKQVLKVFPITEGSDVASAADSNCSVQRLHEKVYLTNSTVLKFLSLKFFS